VHGWIRAAQGPQGVLVHEGDAFEVGASAVGVAIRKLIWNDISTMAGVTIRSGKSPIRLCRPSRKICCRTGSMTPMQKKAFHASVVRLL
jgi:hypothetical protein